MLMHTNQGITAGLKFPQRNICFWSFLSVCTEQSAANLPARRLFQRASGDSQHYSAALTHKPFNCFIILNTRERPSSDCHNVFISYPPTDPPRVKLSLLFHLFLKHSSVLFSLPHSFCISPPQQPSSSPSGFMACSLHMCWLGLTQFNLVHQSRTAGICIPP